MNTDLVVTNYIFMHEPKKVQLEALKHYWHPATTTAEVKYPLFGKTLVFVALFMTSMYEPKHVTVIMPLSNN